MRVSGADTDRTEEFFFVSIKLFELDKVDLDFTPESRRQLLKDIERQTEGQGPAFHHGRS